MPRTGLKSSPELSIQLDGFQSTYCPGSTISGRVVRQAKLVSSRAWVTIQLFGRAKSKMKIKTNNGTSVYRGRFEFFNVPELRQTLYHGPIHVAAEEGPSASWPFSLTIPAGPIHKSIVKDKDHKYSFISTSQEDVDTQKLPPVFLFAYAGFANDFHAYVEFYLKAELHMENKSKEIISTLPIFIRTPAALKPIIDFGLQERSFLNSMTSHRLMPGMEDAELSFRQKSQTFFRTSKVPQLHYTVQVRYPTVIQLENPIPIPLQARVLLRRDRTSEAIHNVPQVVTLVSLSLQLKAHTKVLCAGTMYSHDAEGTKKSPLDMRLVLPTLEKPIVIPFGDDPEPVDIGAILGIRIDPYNIIAAGQPNKLKGGRIFPSFTTYNVAYTHKLEWQMELNVAGGKMKVLGEQPVKILPPCEEWETERFRNMTEEEKKKDYESLMLGVELGVMGLEAAVTILEILSSFG